MEQSNLLRDFEGKKSASGSINNSSQGTPSSMGRTTIILFIVFALFGIGTGYMIASNTSVVTVKKPGSDGTVALQKGDIYGSKDEKAFNDSAEGVLKIGGIEGEGAYHLERPGGESQNVYLTSSVVDLSQFENKKVKVWGQTNTAQSAGWLMDVGRLQLLE